MLLFFLRLCACFILDFMLKIILQTCKQNWFLDYLKMVVIEGNCIGKWKVLHFEAFNVNYICIIKHLSARLPVELPVTNSILKHTYPLPMFCHYSDLAITCIVNGVVISLTNHLCFVFRGRKWFLFCRRKGLLILFDFLGGWQTLAYCLLEAFGSALVSRKQLCAFFCGLWLYLRSVRE